MRGSSRATAFLLAGLALAAWGTGCAPRAPRHGFIAYYNPGGPRKTERGVRPRPATLVFVSMDAAADGSNEDETPAGVHVEVGRGSPTWTDRVPADGEQHKVRAPFNLLNAVPVELSEEQFEQLWLTLEETGLFELPAYPAAEPPEDKAFFIADDTESQTIFVRPKETAMSSLQELEPLKIWARASQVIVTGSYSDSLYHSMDRRQLISPP